MNIRVGVDVGGTSIRAQLFDGTESIRHDEPTAGAGGEYVSEQIARVVLGLIAASGLHPDWVGVGIPGQVDPVAGTVRHAVNLGIDGTPVALARFLEGRIGVGVSIENDVRTAALGAFDLLSAEDESLSDLIYLSIGTGVSAGVIINRTLHRGRHGIAGEIGHAPLDGGGENCRCGLAGCLEAIAGGRSLDTRFPDGARRLFSEDSPDPSATKRVAAAIARAVYVLATAYDPDLLVLGGGIGFDAGPAVHNALSELTSAALLGPTVLTADRVVTLSPEADVGTVGAALLALQPETSGRPDQPQGGNRP